MWGSLRLKIVREEREQIGDPDGGDQPVDMPFHLGIFLRLGGAEDVARRGQNHDQLPAPEHEPAKAGAAEETRRRGALHHIERRGDECVAPEGEDHRRGVQRAQLAEVQIALSPFKVQRGIGQLEGDDDGHEKADNAPEDRRDDPGANHAIEIFVLGGFRPSHGAKHPDERDRCRQHDLNRVHHVRKIARIVGRDSGENRYQTKRDQLDIIPHVVRPFVLSAPRPVPESDWGRGFSTVALVLSGYA